MNYRRTLLFLAQTILATAIVFGIGKAVLANTEGLEEDTSLIFRPAARKAIQNRTQGKNLALCLLRSAGNLIKVDITEVFGVKKLLNRAVLLR